jgi:hypothetical protein
VQKGFGSRGYGNEPAPDEKIMESWGIEVAIVGNVAGPERVQKEITTSS